MIGEDRIRIPFSTRVIRSSIFPANLISIAAGDWKNPDFFGRILARPV
jgi:hypothetical protein